MKLKPPSPKQLMGNFSLATNAPNWWRILVCRFARWSIGCTYISRAFLLLFCVTVSFTQPPNNCLRFRSPHLRARLFCVRALWGFGRKTFPPFSIPPVAPVRFRVPQKHDALAHECHLKDEGKAEVKSPQALCVCLFFVCILLRSLYLERNQAQHTDLPRSCKLMLGFVLFFLCSLFPFVGFFVSFTPPFLHTDG